MTSSSMGASWRTLEAVQSKLDKQRGTVGGAALDHTANSDKIRENGNKPEEWLSYTRFIKNSVEFTNADNHHNFLCTVYENAFRLMPSAENKKSVAFAMLFIEYAKVKREYSKDDCRTLFNLTRANMRRFAIVHVNAAEFELDEGEVTKCKKILEKARWFKAQPDDLLQKAMRNFNEGKRKLLSEEELEEYFRSESLLDCSNDSSGDFSFSSNMAKPSLAFLSDKFPKLPDGAVLRKDHKVDENNTKERLEFDGSQIEAMETNTAPIAVESDRVQHEPSVAPASCSKPPFRSYHSTPDVKQYKSEPARLKFDMLLPRRIKKLDIPIVLSEEESDEEETPLTVLSEEDSDNSFRDIKPLEDITSQCNNISESNNATIASESMDVSHAGHTSGYVSSLSLNSHTKSHPMPHRRLNPILSDSINTDPRPKHAVKSTNRPQPSFRKPAYQPGPINQPVFATPSNHGTNILHIAPAGTLQFTPSMKSVQEICVNGRSYSVLKLVGRGGSSKVFQCIDFEKRENVGIKMVDLSDADDSVINGYKNEITLLKRLQYSDKVIKMYDYEHNVEQCCLFIVMELGDTDLATLFQNASKTKDITESSMKYYWEAMLKAVKVLHKEGIIHSDLKPANFMLVRGQLKLIDFGIANAIQQDRTSVLRDSPVGTLNYMSPEAILDSCGGVSLDGKPQPIYKIGVKCDVWSLGCILYNMVYGHTPFQPISKQLLKMQAIINPCYKIQFKEIPDKKLMDVLQKCLIREVKERPSIDELLNHPYVKIAKESQATPPATMQSFLEQLQDASPGQIRKIKDLLEKRKESKSS